MKTAKLSLLLILLYCLLYQVDDLIRHPLPDFPISGIPSQGLPGLQVGKA